MASTIEAKYGSNNQTITCSIASLGNNNAEGSTAIDNTSNLFLDALVFVKVKTGASGVASTGQVNVYALGTVDGGTTYTEGFAGSDLAITLTSPPNAKLIGIVNANVNATTYYGGPFSVAAAFGGVLPDHWAVVIENKTGQALDSTAGNHKVNYQGVQAQTT